MALKFQAVPPSCAAALAALDVLPDAVAIVEASGPVVHANQRWRSAAPDPDSGADQPPSWPQILVERFGAPAADVEPVAQAAPTQLGDPAAVQTLRWRTRPERPDRPSDRPSQPSPPLGPSDAPPAPRWLEARLAALPGQPGLGLLQIRDITVEHERAETNARLRSELDEALERLRCFAAITSETLVISERGKILFVNEATQRMFGMTLEDAVGRSVLEFSAPECHEEIIRHLSKSNDDTPYEAVCVHKDGRRFMAEVRGRVISYHGRPVRGAAILDVTDRKRAEAALRERLLAEERERAQIETLAALTTLLIPVREDVLVLPLVGDLDSTRLGRVTEALLNGISEHRARCAILDVTGVPKLDGAAATGLVRAAQGGRLLGARILVSGVRAEVAHLLVTLGADLSGLKTYRSLQSAIAAAFAT